jgi:hypothetical protein
MRRVRPWLLWGVGVLAVATTLTAFDQRGPLFQGWLAYLVLTGVCAGLVWLAWRSVAREGAPASLAIALILAIALRLGVGIALMHLLPVYGYDTHHQRAGYFFPDAYERDLDAQMLAASDRPLLTALTDRTVSDQYGGLLLVSAAVYRALSPEVSHPLLIVLLAATVSSLGVLFTWGFAGMMGGHRAAALAAWLVALYPDSILLGASQMREPFIATGLALALYGYARLRLGATRAGVAAIGLGTFLGVLISPPYGMLIAGAVFLAWIWEGWADTRRTAWALGLLAIGVIAALALTIRAWSSISSAPAGNLLSLFSWWLSSGARYQLHVLERGSGMVQALFRLTPEWAHLPMATAYGLLRPFLPAALTESAAPLAQTIQIFRSLGWVILLPFLVYAPFVAWRRSERRNLPAFLTLLVWGTAILASYRAGGDDWDNVRYRTVFLVAQAALAGWAWARARRSGSPWLRRIGVLIGGIMLVFLQWYAGRYFGTPRLELWGTLGAAGAFFLLWLAGSLFLDHIRRRRLTSQQAGV